MGKNYKVRSMAQVRDPKEAGLSVQVRGDSPNEFTKVVLCKITRTGNIIKSQVKKDVWLKNRQFVGNNVLCKKNVTTTNRQIQNGYTRNDRPRNSRH
jgi:hypothetical protein